MATTTVDRSPASDDVRSPSVLVVLVTRDAAGWLRGCLESLAGQTHPRLGVVAVDNGSSDGTLEVLHHALGEGRVVALGENRGLLLRPEMTVHVDFLLEKRDDVLAVPRAALLQEGGRTLLVIDEAGRWVERPVELGLATPQRIEIVSGLEAGETFVADKQAWKERKERER